MKNTTQNTKNTLKYIEKYHTEHKKYIGNTTQNTKSQKRNKIAVKEQD